MTAWKTYGAHALAYALSILPVIQAVAPALVPGHGALIAGLAGVLLTAIHNFQTVLGNSNASAATSRVADGVMKVLPLLLTAVLILGAAMGLGGCATVATDRTARTELSVVVDAATIAAIQHDPDNRAMWAERAEQITNIARQLQSFDSGASMTPSTLPDKLRELISRADVPPEDAVVIQALVTTLQTFIEQSDRAADGAANALEAESTTLAIVLQDVISAASVYLEPH
jgi:hypothetical protein